MSRGPKQQNRRRRWRRTLNASDTRLVWSVFAVVVILLTGSYYEALTVRNDAARKVCETTNGGRVNLNQRSHALAHYITIVLKLNTAAEKIQPPPEKLRKLEAQEITAIKQLRASQKPLRLVSCP